MTNWRYKIGINLMKIIVANIACQVNLFLQYCNGAFNLSDICLKVVNKQ